MTLQNATNEKCFWVVVANEASVIVYTRDSRSGPLRKHFTANNEAARKKTDQLISDSGGRSYDSFGAGRHTMANEKDAPRKHAAMVFAKDIAERIGKVLHDGSCLGYSLVAAPRFLGMLRNALATTTTTEPYAAVDKDVISQDPDVIEKLLKDL